MKEPAISSFSPAPGKSNHKDLGVFSFSPLLPNDDAPTFSFLFLFLSIRSVSSVEKSRPAPASGIMLILGVK